MGVGRVRQGPLLPRLQGQGRKEDRREGGKGGRWGKLWAGCTRTHTCSEREGGGERQVE